MNAPRTALVLSGGGARGAYEAGVVRYLREDLAREMGAQPRFQILSGTSIGAVNAAFLASTAHVPEEQAARLAEVWLSLRLEEVFHWSALALGRLPGYLYRRIKAVRFRTWRLADLVWPEALASTVRQRILWSRLPRNFEDGHLEALTVTATDLGTGRAVTFVETEGELPSWGRDPLSEVRRVSIRPDHVLASGAIPLLFRPVRIDGSWFVDGSVRQTTPLSPAIRLGADRVLVIALRNRSAAPSPGRPLPRREPTTAAQLGRLLSALMVDRADADLDRLRRLNEVLDDGERAFGPDFAERIAAISTVHGAPIRRVRDLVIRPSVDPSIVAREHARQRVKTLRRGTLAARLLARAAADEGASADGFADLASLLLFDREYAGELLALGRADAERQRDALLAFFAPEKARGA
ncbi:MAG TPA: patatin-like phospholipase family protein [Anaeromyxobacteraceae bacterium]|nr:patatin-like phospholipase family protein [Anaeromyxobacteraceae bacterium]